MSESALAAAWGNPEIGTPLHATPRWGTQAEKLGLGGRWYRVVATKAGPGGGDKDWIKISLGRRAGWVRRTYLELRFGRKPPTCRDGRGLLGWRPMPVVSTNYFLWNVKRGGHTRNTSRAWGTCSTVERVRQVLRIFQERHPRRARVGIGDISLRGGFFPGHGSHRRGTDVDLYYPRGDNREISTQSARQMNHRLSQELIDLFIRSGARTIYVGPSTGMRGRGVQVYSGHDNHFHVRY